MKRHNFLKSFLALPLLLSAGSVKSDTEVIFDKIRVSDHNGGFKNMYTLKPGKYTLNKPLHKYIEEEKPFVNIHYCTFTRTKNFNGNSMVDFSFLGEGSYFCTNTLYWNK